MEAVSSTMSWPNAFLWSLFSSLILLSTVKLAEGVQCWQCASVDDRECPRDAKLISSQEHDACITWRLANGTIILQNVVQMEMECSEEKVKFWRSFIDLYYQASGGVVDCCDTDSCNNGESHERDEEQVQDFLVRPDVSVVQGPEADAIPGRRIPRNSVLLWAPLIFGPASNAPPLSSSSSLQSNVGLLSSASSLSELQTRLQQQQQMLEALLAQSPSKLEAGPNSNLILTDSVKLLGFPQRESPPFTPNGNCTQYLRIEGNDEWLPSALLPLALDRASNTKVGVFYVRFASLTSNNNDHVTVRLVDQQRSNSSMYSFKLYRVGSVALFVSRLVPGRNRNSGRLIRDESRRESVNNVINITDQNYSGFWFAVRDHELSLGLIGDPITEPVLTWNDTERMGPMDVFYFGLTSERSEASFGLNCDAPKLHFVDTCVSDLDCQAFPNTECASTPLNKGLDPGNRNEPFEEWDGRDKLLKSCFCKVGFVRIPRSRGCYDPIRSVITLHDACFADHHCHSLPNTQCLPDESVARFNQSCQCTPGNKAFDPNPRTGLVEGCTPLTERDKASVEGCSRRMHFSGDREWVPRRLVDVEKDDEGAFRAVFFVKIDSRRGSAIVRILDNRRSRSKMLGIRFNDNGVAILESRRVRSFLFGTTENDDVRASVQDADLVRRMRADYVGFWMRYRFDRDTSTGMLSVGLSGTPLGAEFAILRWTDDSSSVMRNVGYLGLTGSNSAEISYGVNCVVVDTPLGQNGVQPFVQLPMTDDAIIVNNDQTSFPGANIGSVFGSGMSREELLMRLQQQQRLQQLLQQQLMQQQQLVANRRNDDALIKDSTVLATTTKKSVIIEPVMRNQYLTKLQRLLPSFKYKDDIVAKEKTKRNKKRKNYDKVDNSDDYVMPSAFKALERLVGRNNAHSD